MTLITDLHSLKRLWKPSKKPTGIGRERPPKAESPLVYLLQETSQAIVSAFVYVCFTILRSSLNEMISIRAF
ncbi:hypothetical protein BABINDRAFT_161250 [Babjeviella inositovora NRRL Y-12698]|uniref:Uncharacterized protein n=1 Tax=Babjeviella inositovora NRRL Y-12698 TaxID=984486 RepID=A0A1E3QTN3_9ASCO|nr:uncharacterized protein BABINDRAFT_161250 [Babjeviella inositovora NRRL Y-12698]ODQ80287.1 hypothetical protein BABINDRAFT_161250 [Babjeviella inositovora NRRL Y-12698]